MRLRFGGHCLRSKEEIAHQLILWEPNHGRRSRGRPATTFIAQLMEDIGMRKEDLKNAIDDRDGWRLIRNPRLQTTRL